MTINWGEFNKNNNFNLSNANQSKLTVGGLPEFQGQDYSMNLENFMKSFGNSGSNFNNNSWKNEANSGLGGYGTMGDWEAGFAAFDALNNWQNTKLMKEDLNVTKQNNRFQADMSLANFGMAQDNWNANLLDMQAKASGVRDWVSSQGGRTGKYDSIEGLQLAKPIDIKYG